VTDVSLIYFLQTAGDKVLLPDFGGVSVKEGDNEMFLFREDEILAKIEK
jgi:co-chaperonin GroES (HSP10)